MLTAADLTANALYTFHAVLDRDPPATSWVFTDDAGKIVAAFDHPTPTLDIPLALARTLRLTARPRAPITPQLRT